MKPIIKFLDELTTFRTFHLILALGLITFANCLFNNFVSDDYVFIINNPEVHHFNIFELLSKNMFNNLGYYRPIPAVYFASLYSMFSTQQFFYHLIQIALHMTNTFLVFLLLKKFFSDKLSLFLSSIFLVHPIQVESVSYIAAAGNPLFFLFGILALKLSQKDISNTKNQVWIFLLLFLSLLTKETGILFILMIAMYLFLFSKKHVLTFTLCIIPIILIYLYIRLTIGGTHFAIREYIPIMTLSFTDRLMNIPLIIFYYLKTFFYPITLAVNQTWIVKSVDFSNFFFPLILLIGIFLALCLFTLHLYKRDKKTGKIFFFFYTWLLLGLLFHAQLVPLDFTVADRWFYFTIVGLLGLIGISINEVKKIIKIPQQIILICSFFVLTLLVVRTIERNNNWHDAFTLYSHDVLYTQSNLLENDLGLEYLSQGNYDEAITHFNKSITILPFEVNSYNLGLAYAKKHDDKNAKKYFKQSVQNYKGFVGYSVLAKLLLLYNDPEDAKTLVNKGLTSKPLDPELTMYLTIAEYNMGNKQRALDLATGLYSQYPNNLSRYLLYQITNNLPIALQ